MIAQDPPANATDVSAPKVSLLVAQSPSPKAYVMPNFTGKTLGYSDGYSAERRFRGRNGYVGSIDSRSHLGQPGFDNSADYPAGHSHPNYSFAFIHVVSQEPTQGQKVIAGAAINFVVR